MKTAKIVAVWLLVVATLAMAEPVAAQDTAEQETASGCVKLYPDNTVVVDPFCVFHLLDEIPDPPAPVP